MTRPTTVDWRDFRHVDWFLKEGPGQAYKGAAFAVYLVDQVLSFGPGRIALPLAGIGPRLRARGFETQQAEAAIGVAVLNRMLAAGRPDSVRRMRVTA